MKNILLKTISGVIEISRGMFTIFKHTFRPAITLEYPEQKPEFNARYKGKLALTVNPDGSDLCTGCQCCAKVCPCGDLIQIEVKKDENNARYVDKFTIDVGRCIFCGNCTEVCPKGALIMTNHFELADYSRESLVFDKKRLTLTPDESEKWRERRDKEL